MWHFQIENLTCFFVPFVVITAIPWRYEQPSLTYEDTAYNVNTFKYKDM